MSAEKHAYQGDSASDEPCRVDGCGQAWCLWSVHLAPVASPSTDTAGDQNRWTAEVEPPLMAGDWAHLVAIDSERRDDEDDGREVFLLDSLDSAESLAAQINRPAPDPDLRSQIEAMRAKVAERRTTAAGSTEPYDQDRYMHAAGALVAIDAVLALLDAGEPPTGSGCA